MIAKGMASVALLLLLTGGLTPAVAQESAEKALEQLVFPPELVMKNAQRLNLTDAQRDDITRAIQQAQSRTVEVQWKLQREVEGLMQLLQATTPDESAVLGQVDKVLALEREVKRAHMQMLVRIKGTLTREQQEILRAQR